MGKMSEIPKFHIELNEKQVFQGIGCKKEQHNYQEILKELEALKPTFFEIINPQGIFKIDSVLNTSKVLFLITIGEEISNYSTELFQKGEYLQGLLIDAMADSYLFALQNKTLTYLKKECGKKGLFLLKSVDISQNTDGLEYKTLFEELEAEKTLGMKLTSHNMFYPVKSMGEVVLLTDTEQCFREEHNCSECELSTCIWRKEVLMKIKVIADGIEKELECQEKETLLSIMQREELFMNPVCAGKGTCGKCKVRVVKGKIPITKEDRLKFTPLQLQQGFRLACRMFPVKGCIVELPYQGKESASAIVTNYSGFQSNNNHISMVDTSYSIGIDLGTTTLVITLVGNQSKEIRKQYACTNSQRTFGSDVISRILAANEGAGSHLREYIRTDILQGINNLKESVNLDKNSIDKIVISGNTTMIHLLLGYSCQGLSTYPFSPVELKLIRKSFEEVFADTGIVAEVIFFPGISAFVGGDIVSGLYACEFDTNEELCLLVDLGTNGEMALGNKTHLWVTSTAAGPAFEGGNITWGMSSLEGAISSVSIVNGVAKIKTIGNKQATGLCGTGVIETAAALYREGYIKEDGLLCEPHFTEGFPLAKTKQGENIVFTQADIRELQLAKAAIRAGLEALIKKANINYDKIKSVYLAGGLGFNLKPEIAVTLGILPKELVSKVQVIGNSSLGGAIKYVTDKQGESRLEHIVENAQEVLLANDTEFTNLYMKHMFFNC